jgi:hypothetical protein
MSRRGHHARRDGKGADRWIKTIVVRTAADYLDWYGDENPQRLN